MTEDEIYSLPFDIDRHKLLPYHPKLEVMIALDGAIEYAQPSHQEFLMQKAMQKNRWTRDDLMKACPPKYHCDFMVWLIMESGGYIPVWEYGILNYPLTKEQTGSLRKLKIAGLYRGYIPPYRRQDSL